jgi:hypothetical protein
MSVRTTEYDIKREGVFGSFTYDAGMNKLTVGGWLENNDFQQAPLLCLHQPHHAGDRLPPLPEQPVLHAVGHGL